MLCHFVFRFLYMEHPNSKKGLFDSIYAPNFGTLFTFFLQRPNLLTDLLAHFCYISKFNFHVTLNLSFISPSKFPLSRNFEGTNPSENHGVIFTRRRFWSNKELSCHLRLRYSTLHFGNSQIFHSSFLGFSLFHIISFISKEHFSCF